ncbi:MAG: S8 family serine peptidase, partial [Deltaproteobacteria bacterium]|nr:S8 family serine peptidase [Deltaproteobacteria bacterium]
MRGPVQNRPLILAFAMTMSLVAGFAHAGELEPPLGMIARGLVPDAMMRVPQLIPAIEQKDGSWIVPVLIRTSGDADLLADDLRAAGVRVGRAVGPIVTATVDSRLLEDVAARPNVAMVELAWPVRPLLDISAPLIEADRVWDEFAVRGEGAVVGVVDTGTAWNHPDFYDPDTGESRIEWLWDQSLRPEGEENGPADYSYGVEYTRDELTAAFATGDPNTLRTWDDVGHGTHVLGTAGGNGAATGNGYPSERYVGIAPAAHLVAVKANLIASFVLDGVAYVFERAADLGLPAVVNLSLGTHLGAHDGTSGLDQGVAALAGPGRIIVAGAGNEQHMGYHARVTLAEGETKTVTFLVGAHDAHDIIPDILAIAAYPPRDSDYTFKVTSPGGEELESGPHQPGSAITPDGIWLLDNAFLFRGNDLNGLATTLIALVGNPLTAGETRNLLAPGTWTIEITANDTPGTETIDLWIMASLMNGQQQCCTTFDEERDEGYMVASPASSDGAIAVGAYYSRFTWTNESGDETGYGVDYTLGDLAFFSNHGPRPDGMQKPEIVAPGFGIAAAVAHGSEIAGAYAGQIVEDGEHIVLQGTSM